MFRKISLTFTLIAFVSIVLSGQCKTWIGSPKMNDAENAHSIYRAALKTNDFEIAFENWKKAYDIAPAADGKRDFHYTDGIKIYKQLFKKTQDAALKKEYAGKILSLYDEAIACYQAKGIEINCNEGEDCYAEKVAYLMGRKGYDMYYELNQSYIPTIDILEKAIAVGGMNVEYIVLNPLANMIVYQFIENKIDAVKAREIHATLNGIADYNVINSEKYGPYFQQAIDGVNGEFAKIERQIFDCNYFINKLQPEYDSDPNNIDLVKDLYNELRKRGCEDDVPLLAEMKVKYEAWALKVNAEKQAEFEANNPAMVANNLYKDGDFKGAIAKYDEAIATETDPEKKANYYFSKASIQFRKLKNYGEARNSARKAAELKSNWGKPYMLIGDMYGHTASSCGDSWNQRLAILAAVEKYGYAKSIDSEVSEDANDRIGKYRASFPAQEEGFMRKLNKGDRVSVGCWIGETVTIQYK